ncbi:class I SAM-dependent methyltransferase [Novipirellula caenicola]|uniref:Methyltransferase domain-containing protein n=1 Tax=Novipirellula caenicola TaxID=1536901 RepID=A0ABP9W0E9_9BACT
MPSFHEQLREIDKSLNERYSGRLRNFGDDPRTLGWDTQANQRVRFALACREIDVSDAAVLDVGCGLADFRSYLNDSGNHCGRYIGVDINPDLLQQCRTKFPDDTFRCGNLLVDELPDVRADFAVMFGVLNFRFAEINNLEFAKSMIAAAFDRVDNALVFDMLTTVRDEDYPEEDFVYYYNPSEILEFAFSLTPHVTLRHDYPSIPQREMMLCLRKHADV